MFMLMMMYTITLLVCQIMLLDRHGPAANGHLSHRERFVHHIPGVNLRKADHHDRRPDVITGLEVQPQWTNFHEPWKAIFRRRLLLI
jgi:hypothetical protein